MRLRDWLESTGRTPAWLAERTGVTEKSVRRWINGSCRPDYERLLRIEELSEGEVTAEDVLRHPSPKRGPGRPPGRRLTAEPV